MGNGGVRDSLRIQSLSTTISISPVAMAALIGFGRAQRPRAFDGDHVFRREQLHLVRAASVPAWNTS